MLSIYPALSYEWNNLLLACPVCNAAKRDKFPLQPDGRSPQEDKLNPCCDRSGERSFLIDPTIDDPSEHFSFYFYGPVDGKFFVSMVKLNERGRYSHDVYGLNRESLQDAWCKKANELYAHVQTYWHASAGGNANEKARIAILLKAAMQPSAEHSAMARAFLGEFWDVVQ